MMLAVSGALIMLGNPGCGDDEEPGPPAVTAEEPTTRVEVSAEFESNADRDGAAAVHAWVLGLREGSGATCAKLVGGDVDPYDVTVILRADMVSLDASQAMAAEGVTLGEALVYVEASDFSGSPYTAGCVQAAIAQPLTAVIVPMGPARVYDCASPDASDGDPCDDGNLCTVREACEKGKCQGGVPRDCTHLTDECNAGSCDEQRGCVTQPLPDGTPCDDDLYCTAGEACNEGSCLGSPRDCGLNLATCQVVVGCDEAQDTCIIDVAPYGTQCDDDMYCTTQDQCDSYGNCGGSSLDCSELDTECATGACDESSDSCIAQPLSQYTYCSDGLSCTLSDRCDGAGACAGTPRDCTYLNDQCNEGVCAEPAGSCQKQPLAEGTPCNDGISATTGDQCTATGSCQGTLPEAGLPDAGGDASGD